jgi:ribosomal protein L11 methyltransferase
MAWLKLTLRAAKDQAERLSELLDEHGAIAVTLEDAINDQLIETRWDQTPLWREVTLSALFPVPTDGAALLEHVRLAGIELLGPAATGILEDQDWARVWMDRYQPIKVGRGLWICPSWCTPPEPDAVNIILDPGLAFGTGTHATTALCLQWLSEQNLRAKDVIDYGCGSGILAIAALKLGARHAVATDLDPQALAVTRENAVRNGVADRLQVCEPATLPETTNADVVVANILAGALVELAPRLTALTRAGGQLALSGIMSHQAEEVRAAYATSFELLMHAREEWVLLAGTKR